jgi:amino acid permease
MVPQNVGNQLPKCAGFQVPAMVQFFVLLGCYASFIGNTLTQFRENIRVEQSKKK